MSTTLKNIASLLAVSAALCIAMPAAAADRTVCYRLVFKDDRNDCPVTGDAGARRACQASYYNWSGSTPDGYYTAPVGGYIEVWDRDGSSSSNDEYIGTWVIGGTGTRCVSFEWESASYSLGEAEPDVYLKWKSKVRAIGGSNARVKAVDGSGIDYGGVTWRNYYYSNCQTGSSCELSSGYFIISTDTATEVGGRAQVLDSAQHMLQLYDSIMDDRTIEVTWPASGSATSDRGSFRIESPLGGGTQNRALMAQSTTHELGHILQMQLFGQDDLRDDCSLNGSGHSLGNVAEYESCATAEGWAGYVAATSLWDPGDTGSQPARFGVPFENATPLSSKCSANGGFETQVIKGFWDLDDANNEPASSPATKADLYNAGTIFIANGWDQFPSGTGNRDDYEDDENGVNLWDYYYDNYLRFSSYTNLRYTLLNHNCTDSQQMW